ncbi:MAG: alpha amylase C-terminal domain-containing protein, partial [Ruminococcus sp.]|nr:alpha amylase C-terminal domain-containing protein [Ruminococcus sp.]
QWGLLQYEKHQKLNHFFADINKFYKDNAPMHTVDFNWEGFNWIHHDDYNQSVIAFRRIDTDGNDIVVICNFQPMYRENYSIGVPQYGVYSEVFNSDDAQYGGNGISNGQEIKTADVPLHGLEQSITLNLPPMSAIYLKCTQVIEKPKKKAARKPAAKKTTKKAEEKKPAEKKTATKKAATTKKAAEKKADEKPAEKKPAAKKTTAKKAAAKTTKTTKAKAEKETKSDK